jgi:hypothetical protein
MSTFAILGATGATGQQLVRCLLQNPENRLHLYVRSQPKLLKIFPEIQNHEKVRIFEGSMNDIELVSACLDSTKAVFSVLASNDNIPGMTIARDSAATIVSALKTLKERDIAAKLPRVVVLSSTSVNPLLYQNEPKLLHWIVYNAFWHLYQDLKDAERLYAQALEDGTLMADVRFVQPAALVDGDCSGVVSLSQDKMSQVLTYGDLARAMVQAGEDPDLKLHKIGVVVDGEKLSFQPGLPMMVLEGLIWTFAPWMYKLCQYLNVK